MELQVKNINGKVVDRVQVRDDVFDMPMNRSLVQQVVVGQLANTRQGTVKVKTRGQVSGGGRKPRVQKHSGMARAGSTRAPNWRGGGVVFGPSPRSFRHNTPKRMRRSSLVATLSEKVRAAELVVLDALKLERPVTKEIIRVLDALEAGPSVLLVADGTDSSTLRAARNVPRLKMIPGSLLNTLDLLNHRTVIITLDAVRKVEELWGGPLARGKGPSGRAVAQA